MIVHIGYHKTGTTYLQENIFPNLIDIDFRGYEESKSVLKPVYKATSLEFSPQTIKLTNQSNSFYSFEGLVGEIGVGTYNKEIANRLKLLNFKKIVITIRRQDSMLESLYRQYLQRGGITKKSVYFKGKRFFKESYLNYFSLVDYYIQEFGQENVLVLPFEQMKYDLPQFVESLTCFLNTNVESFDICTRNRSLSKPTLQLLRIINHFTHNHFKQSNLISDKITTWRIRRLLSVFFDSFVRKTLGNGMYFSDTERNNFLKIYHNSNKKLDSLLGVDLNHYGYY